MHDLRRMYAEVVARETQCIAQLTRAKRLLVWAAIMFAWRPACSAIISGGGFGADENT